MQSTTKRNGTLAEVLFTAEVVKRGMAVSLPVGENQHYDHIVDNGQRLIRIQVKASYTLSKRNCYQIATTSRTSRRIDGKRTSVVIRHLDGYDILAAYVGPRNAWYLIPADAPEISTQQGIDLKPDIPVGKRKRTVDYEKYRENWSLLSN